jgi:hypothetical protein
MRSDESTERLAKAICRSLLNERDAQSTVGGVHEAMEGLAYAIGQGWIDNAMQLTEAGRQVALKSRAGKQRRRVFA